MIVSIKSDGNKLSHYYARGYHSRSAFVERVARDYSYQAAIYDVVYGSFDTAWNLVAEVTPDYESQVTYVEVLRR